MENLNDQELVTRIKQNPDCLGIVYKQCKNYSIKFMRNMTSNKMAEYELEDVFHDAVIVLYEKIIKGDFILTASLQVYLNSVCRFQLLTKFRKDKKVTDFQENSENDDDDSPMAYRSTITDSLEETEEETEEQFRAIERALLKMKAAGGHCYELLTLFWYHKKSMNELTTVFGYSNADNTKNQKAKCQKRLEKMAFNELNS